MFHSKVRGSSGEHSEAVGGKYDISNRERMGITEFQAVQKMYEGVAELIKMEQELEKSGQEWLQHMLGLFTWWQFFFLISNYLNVKIKSLTKILQLDPCPWRLELESFTLFDFRLSMVALWHSYFRGYEKIWLEIASGHVVMCRRPCGGMGDPREESPSPFGFDFGLWDFGLGRRACRNIIVVSQRYL